MSEDPCVAMRLLVQADLDGELDAAGAAALAGHIAGCEACGSLQRDLGHLSGRLRTELARHAATPGLRRAVEARLRAEAPHRRRIRPGISSREAFGFAAGMALAASVAMVALPTWQPDAQPERLAMEVVAAHIRALQPGHLLDVVSTDRHTVEPWFDGRLDFAPPVKDFAGQGFVLVGGRLDYLAGRPVAALVYRHDRHLVDLFIWPGAQASTRRTVQGYTLLAWSQEGMNFRLVSDLNTDGLQDLMGLLRQPG